MHGVRCAIFSIYVRNANRHKSLTFHLKQKKKQRKTWYFYLVGVSIVRILKANYNHLRRGIVCGWCCCCCYCCNHPAPHTKDNNRKFANFFLLSHTNTPVRRSSSNSHWLRQLWFSLTQSQVDRHTCPKIEFNFPMFTILFFTYFFHSFDVCLNCILIFVVAVVFDSISTASICILSANHA